MPENNHIPAPYQVSVEVGGRALTLETGKIAKQANGAIVARYGDTVILNTACMATKANDKDFLPLTVDYRENTYSAGKIPGGFFKREGRPTEKEILTSRLIDRPMRPLFPESWRNETQVNSMVLSADSDNDPDVIAVTGAAAAAYCSDLPFPTPIAAVRVGLVNGQLVANPTVAEQKTSLLNIVIAGSEDAIMMVESGALEVSEETVVEALEFGHAQVKMTKRAFDRLKEDIFRDEILNARRRPDGRAFDKIRKITCEVGLLPRVHGSALFTRGETQALATLTLGTIEDQQRLDLLFAQ